jgi:nucleoside-diphosphate-sugar epimerase
VNVLVTGASGFVGSALVEHMLEAGGIRVRAAVRQTCGRIAGPVEYVDGELSAGADWRPALAGIDAVVHLAARVHVMHETAADALAEFRRVNVDGSIAVARQAAAAGVRRFVYLSSVKVNGESGRFVETDRPAPKDPYAISKYEAETALQEIAAGSQLEVAIVRPPLVYGPRVQANFAALMRAISRGVPLPLGAIDNRRSLIGIDNLTAFILRCLEHPAAGNQTFLVSDGEDLSTTDLVRRLARAMGRPARLLPVPPALLLAGATVLGRGAAASRLVGSLSVDIGKARRQLAWSPPRSVDDGLRRAVLGCP